MLALTVAPPPTSNLFWRIMSGAVRTSESGTSTEPSSFVLFIRAIRKLCAPLPTIVAVVGMRKVVSKVGLLMSVPGASVIIAVYLTD